jgi:hypothetical protein
VLDGTTTVAPTEAPVTEPPETEPPETEPPATEPPATEPPETEPPETEPPATEPPATEPPATEPPATEPPATEPPATEPPATEPPATEPPATEPPATEPPATEPPATEPPATEPPATEPPTTEAPTTVAPTISIAPSKETISPCNESIHEDCTTIISISTSTSTATTPTVTPTTILPTTVTTPPPSDSPSTSIETTTVSRPYYLNIECYQGTMTAKSGNETIEILRRDRSSRLFPPGYNENLNLFEPDVGFDFEECDENEIQIVLGSNYHQYDIFLLYYPGFLEITNMSQEKIQNSLHCQIVVSSKILVRNLVSSTVYTFCVLIKYQPIISPFQCKSKQTKTPFSRQTWIYQEQKMLILTSFLVIIFVALFIGVVMTYLLIRRMPTLMRGSKRVVMVNNRKTDVMVLPSGSRNNSWQKETSSSIKLEPPTYLTPLPRKSLDNK